MDEESRRKIIHIDLDAFFASVEQRDNPELRGKPVLVGGKPEERGVVAAASYEARRFGVHSAMPMKTAVRLCRDAVIVPNRISHYRHVSEQIREIFRKYTDLVEPIALDECFLDVTQNKRGMPYATEVAKSIKAQIRTELSLTASAGVAPNKFLAKMASDMDKPDGLFVIKPHGIEVFLENLPVQKIWGVGPVTEKRLHEMGIETIGQLREISLERLIREFGKVGGDFYHFARGVDDRPVHPREERKSISRETTFATDLFSTEKMKAQLRQLSEDVAQCLQAEGLRGRRFTLKVRYPNLTIQTRSQTLPAASADKEAIFSTAVDLLQKTEAEQFGVRLLGVGVSHWDEENPLQLRLFE
ncbi:MAG: DNA polymerase IV [Candidatus Poribacteria bacterium]|nr:DNA polymerase IV [Candidatus Poribacteria bacterium]